MTLFSRLKEIPYWLDPPILTKSWAGLSLPHKTDVLVVGSGYTGTTAAIRLRQAGAQVVLVDQEKLATRASARNGGMTLTGLSKGVASCEKKLGHETVKRLFREALESVNTVERIVTEGQINCHFNRYGHLEAAFKPSHFEHLKHEQEYLATRFNHETTLIAPKDLPAEIGSTLYHGALLDPVSAGVQPAGYIAGLVSLADQSGVELHEGVTAEHIERRARQFVVRTSRGEIVADDVIIATNGYTSDLTPWLQRRLVSTRSLMIATEKLPEHTAQSLIPKGRMIFDTKIFLYYFRLSPDGKRLLFGGRPKSQRMSLRQNAEHMHRHMLKVYPQLKDVRIDYAWWGKLGFTRDKLPHVGQHEGCHYALGYCGHGVALATYCGEKLAEMVLGHEAHSAFTDLKFRAIPLYNGKAWFRPILYSYYGIKDRFF
jgi:glycine/D-amino acid oxidase-like deaminating enzyme